MDYLVVVSHPDDEALGAGAWVHLLARTGNHVSLCVLSGKAQARKGHPGTRALEQDMQRSCDLLGIEKCYVADFPNIQMNGVPHLALVQFIESAIIASKAQTIITHHPADLNNDHLHTSLACQAASKLSLRRTEIPPLRELLFMETPSSTEWAMNTAIRSFSPNFYVDVDIIDMEAKLRAIKAYRGVERPYPHPRSEKAVKALASFRGIQAGFPYAEAYESVFRTTALKLGG